MTRFVRETVNVTVRVQECCNTLRRCRGRSCFWNPSSGRLRKIPKASTSWRLRILSIIPNGTHPQSDYYQSFRRTGSLP